MNDDVAILRTIERRIALRPREVAEAAGLSLETVKNLIRRGLLPVCRVGRANCILVTDVESFLLLRRERRGSA